MNNTANSNDNKKNNNILPWFLAFISLVTALGGPTIFPDLVKRYLEKLNPKEFPVTSPPTTESNDCREENDSLKREVAARDKKIIELTNTTNTSDPEPSIPIEWTTTAQEYLGRLDQDFTCNCPASGRVANVWGTDIYTFDSSICTAAVHQGLIKTKDGGTITIRILAGEQSYHGSSRNGIVSRDWREMPGSFKFVR